MTSTSFRLPLGCTTCPTSTVNSGQQTQNKSQAHTLSFAGKPDSFEKASSKQNQSSPQFAGVFGPYSKQPTATEIYELRGKIDPASEPESGRVTYFALPSGRSSDPKVDPDYFIATMDDAVTANAANEKILANRNDEIKKETQKSILRGLAAKVQTGVAPDSPEAKH